MRWNPLAWLQRLGRGIPRGDADEATHVHHALIITLLFGKVGALAGALLPSVSAFAGFRVGVLIGFALYALYELSQPHKTWRVQWDGLCDILVPAWIVLPVALDVWWLTFPLGATVALLYTVFHPAERITWPVFEWNDEDEDDE